MLQTLETEIRWNAEVSPSAIHCCMAIVAGKTLPEPELHEAMLTPSSLLLPMLKRLAAGQQGNAARFANQLLFSSARIGNNHELAEFTLRKSMGSGFSQSLRLELTQFVIAAEQAFNSHYPAWRGIAEALNQKRQLNWKVYGSALTAAVGALTEAALVPLTAEFVPLYAAGLIRPNVDVLSNVVLIEYDDTLDELTSGMQLVWLALLLNLEMESLIGEMNREKAVEIGRLAMVPVVMAAAAAHHNTPFDQPELDRLMTAWNVKADQQTQQTLLKWWDVYSTRRPTWQTAMNGLQHLLEADAGV